MAFLACALTSNAQAPAPGLKTTPPPAQHRLLSKGEPMPFTGVATALETYRLEGAKMKKQAEAIASYKEEVAGLKKDVQKADSAQAAMEAIIYDQRQLNRSALNVANTLKRGQDDLLVAYEAVKPRWYEKPLVVGPLSFTAGALLTAYGIYKVTR